MRSRQPSREPSRNLTNGETRQEERTGQPSRKTQIWDAVDRTAEGKPDLETFCKGLEQQGIDVQFHVTREGVVRGMAYQLQGDEPYRVTSKKLSKGYRFPDLLSERLNLSLEKDAEAIAKRATNNSQERLETEQVADKIRRHPQNLKLNVKIALHKHRQARERLTVEQAKVRYLPDVLLL